MFVTCLLFGTRSSCGLIFRVSQIVAILYSAELFPSTLDGMGVGSDLPYHVCVRMSVSMCVHARVLVFVCARVRACVCVYVRVRACACTCVCTCACACACVRAHACLRYMYACTHSYVMYFHVSSFEGIQIPDILSTELVSIINCVFFPGIGQFSNGFDGSCVVEKNE